MRHGFCVNQCVFGQPSPAGTRPPPARPRDPPGHAGAPGGGGRRRRAVDRAREGTAGGGAGAQAAGRARDGMVGGGGRQAAGRRGTGRRVRRRATSRGGPGARRGGRRRAGGGAGRCRERIARWAGKRERIRGGWQREAPFSPKKRGCAPRNPPPWSPTKVIRGFFQEERRATTLPRRRTPSPPAHNLAFWRKRRRKTDGVTAPRPFRCRPSHLGAPPRTASVKFFSHAFHLGFCRFYPDRVIAGEPRAGVQSGQRLSSKRARRRNDRRTGRNTLHGRRDKRRDLWRTDACAGTQAVAAAHVDGRGHRGRRHRGGGRRLLGVA